MSSSGNDKQNHLQVGEIRPKAQRVRVRRGAELHESTQRAKAILQRTIQSIQYREIKIGGGLARKGVLRVHHDDVKATEEQTNRPDRFDEVIEDAEVLRLREERAQKREQREARKRELQAEAKAALERANSKPVRKSGKAKRPAIIKQYKRKPLSNKRNSNQDVSAKLRKILGSAEGQKAYKRLREADAFFQ